MLRPCATSRAKLSELLQGAMPLMRGWSSFCVTTGWTLAKMSHFCRWATAGQLRTCGFICRRNPRDHVYSSVGSHFREGRHEGTHQDRCAKCRRWNKRNGGVSAEEPTDVRAVFEGYMEGIQYLKSHKDESLKIFSRYVRNSDLTIMANLYEEIATRIEPGLRPRPEAVRALLDLAALDYPKAQKLTEKDNWDLSLIDEIQRSGFLDQLYKK